jgi:hypothetical protein
VGDPAVVGAAAVGAVSNGGRVSTGSTGSSTGPGSTAGTGSTGGAGAAVGIGAVLRGALAGMWEQVERTPGRQLLTYEITTLSLREAGLTDVARQQYATTVALATEVLERAAAAAGVTWTRDIDHVAGLVVMAIDGATLRWLVDHDSDAALARLGDVADLLTTMTA